MDSSGRNEMDIALELTLLALKNETAASLNKVIWTYLTAYANVSNAARNYPDASKLITSPET